MPLIETQPDEVAQMYASSLFGLAMEHGKKELAEELLTDLQGVLELAREDPMFSEFLSSQVVPVKARDASITRIFEDRAHKLTVNFLRLLNRKGRLGHLPAIVEAYDHLVQDAFGRVEVDVYTADTLSEAERDSIRDRVAEKIGKEVVLHAYVDPQMLGGVKLKIGDQLVDDSLATQLRRVRDRLINEGGPQVRSRASTMIDTTPIDG